MSAKTTFSKKCKLKQDILTDRIRFQLLNIEIRDLHTRIFHINRNIQKITVTLENIVGKGIMSLFLDYYTTKLQFIIKPLQKKLEKKLDIIFFKKYNERIDKDRYIDLESKNTGRANPLNQNTQGVEPYIAENKYEYWCVNLSDIQLPTYVIDTLKLGEKFNFNDIFKKQLTLQYLKNFEMFLNNHIDDNKMSKIRGTFLNTLQKIHNKKIVVTSHIDKKFKIDLEKTKTFIEKNPGILITRADKGNATVIIQKSAYLEKTENLFKDKKYYKEINTNPLPSLERKTNELTKKFNNMDFYWKRQKVTPSVTKVFYL